MVWNVSQFEFDFRTVRSTSFLRAILYTRMHIRRWNIRQVSLILSGFLLIYVLFSSGYRQYEIENIIENTAPEEIWAYVADFSKMRLLNPTILSFKILSDSGHTHHWEYTVEYTERLSHWPYWLNTAKANYHITKSMPDVVPTLYAIKSAHQTCFFKGIYCLNSFSEFEFTARGGDTYCLERIQYQCPPFLTTTCRRELEFQRKAVMHNLTTIFNQKNN